MNLVFDTTSGTVSSPVSTTPSTGTAVAPSGSLAVSSLPTATLADASYSYGTPVNPSEVLGAKKGGLEIGRAHV